MFVAATTAIARDLAVVVASGGMVLAEDLDCALAAHAQVVELLETVHQDLLGRRPRPETARDVALLDADPVGLLGRLLRDHPRAEVQVATTDLLSEQATSGSGRRWQNVLRNATVASYAWRNAERQSLPRGATAWAVMADLAAIAQTVACVTPRLATSARRAGDDSRAQVLSRGTPGALWRAGAQVRALAGLGPLPAVPEPRTRARWPVRIRHAGALPEAQARLRSLLRQAVWLRPDQVGQIATAQVRCLRIVAPSLPPRQANAAVRLARAVGQILRSPGSFAAIYDGDQRALVQAQEIDGFLAKIRLIPPELLDPYEAWAAAVPSTLEELCSAVGRHVWLGRWLVPDPDNRDRWVPPRQRPHDSASPQQRHETVEPRLILAVRHVSYAAKAATPALQPSAWRAEVGRARPSARHLPAPALPASPVMVRRSTHPGLGPRL